MKKTFVSLLIPTYKLSEVECLIDSLKILVIPLNAEVVVLDDASDDQTFEKIKGALKDSKIKYFQNETNQGRSFVRNKLANLSKSCEPSEEHWLVYVDGDCSFDSDLLTRWCETLALENSNSCVIGRVRYKAVEVSSFSRYLDRSSGPWSKKIIGELPHKYFATGHVAISKRSFDLVNGFDEAYKGWGGEDYDLGKRLTQAGVKLAMKKDLVVMHPPIQNVKLYFARLDYFAQNQLVEMLKGDDAQNEDFFGLKKYSKFPFNIIWAIPGLQKWFTRLLSVDDTPWPFWLYKITIFLTCYNGLKKRNKNEKV